MVAVRVRRAFGTERDDEVGARLSQEADDLTGQLIGVDLGQRSVGVPPRHDLATDTEQPRRRDQFIAPQRRQLVASRHRDR